MTKLIVIVGITGNQGGSVASTFLKDPTYKIRGLTRSLDGAPSQALISKGVEMVQADINDVTSLKHAFAGADIIFGNTAFSNSFAQPTAADIAKLKQGQSLREWCYELEVQQGKNIADAVASVPGLQLFIWSTLSHASKWSKGTYSGIYHFDSKAIVVDYIREKYPETAIKMSLLQLGLFITNWKWGQAAVPWEKKIDGSFVIKIPGNGDLPIPLFVPTETGKFVHALAQEAPGTNLLAYNDLLQWVDYVKLWSKITNVKAEFEKSSVKILSEVAPGGYGEEIGEMYAYAMDFGYWGKDDETVIFPKDLKNKVEVMSIEEYIKNEDWSELLNRPVPTN